LRTRANSESAAVMVNEAKELRVLSCRFTPSGYRFGILTFLIEPVKEFLDAPVLSEERKLTYQDHE
jgi:hypothetical protein